MTAPEKTKSPKLTKTQARYFHYMADAMRRLEWDLHDTIHRSQRIPEAWHVIGREKGRDKKVKITIGIEAGVVRFFKSMGSGYQNRMNDVLSAWVHGRLAGLIEGPETLEEFKFEEAGKTPKPEWGTVRKEMQGK